MPWALLAAFVVACAGLAPIDIDIQPDVLNDDDQG